VTSEAVTLTRHSDSVLLVVKQGYTLKNHLKELLTIVDHKKIIGTVLNNVDMRSISQYEYKKYQKKYYYRNPKDSKK
jgi:Mrp family chromosome partitioning ATPase